MAKLNKYLMIHNNPGIDGDEVQANWRKMAAVESGTWIKSYFNEEKGERYCIWLAVSEEELKNIFTEIGINWDSIVQVEETVPDLWGKKWEKRLKKDTIEHAGQTRHSK